MAKLSLMARVLPLELTTLANPLILPTMSALVTELTQRRKAGPYQARPIGNDGAFAYSSPSLTVVADSIDEAEMSAEFVIVSSVEDREYDVITPSGCEEYLAEYRANPIVLLEHDALKPVGLSTDKAGNFHFRILQDRIIAKCFFHCLPLNGENLSEEVFRLVMKGVFRGASPGFLPIQGRKRGYSKDAGYEYSRWRLTEWSITCQPVNQNALRLSLAGVRCKSLRKSLEPLLMPKQKASSITVGDGISRWSSVAIMPGIDFTLPEEVKSMKPKTAAIEFDKDVFADQPAAVAWLDQHGYDSSACTPLPASLVFKQRDGKPNAGKKSLGKGVWALLTKAFGKEENDDEEDKKKPAEDKADEMDDKVEKGEPDDEEDADDESDDLEDSDAEDAADDDESEEAETEDTTEYDPAALKQEANNLMDMIAHFEIACEHAERMKGEAVKSPELIEKLHADAQALVADLRAAYKDGFADQAMEDAIQERKAGAQEKEDLPAPTADETPDEYKELAKALKLAKKGLDEASVTAKSLPRAVA